MRTQLTFAAALVLVTCSLVSALPAAQPWSFQDEVYHICASSLNLQEMKSAGITLVSHAPCTKEYLDQAHALGIRVAPYVSLYKAVDLSEWPEGNVHPFWRELDLAKAPGWVLIGPDGTRRRPFDNPDYRRGAYQSCCSAPGIAEGYVRGVKALMDMGADGIFVDNVHPSPKCYGVELGVQGHEHLFPDKSNAEMYRVALAEVCKAVKSYGDDKVVILNGSAEYKNLADAMMWESYIGAHGSRVRNPDWKGVLSGAARWAEYIRTGKAVAALTYLWGITPYGDMDDAYYSYACAKLSGFHWTASTGHWAASLHPEFGPGATDWSATTERSDVLRVLYRARPGQAIGPMAERDGIMYRLYENALVAVNPSGSTVMGSLPLPPGCEQPTDLYTGAMLRRRGGTFTATLPSESGRVYLSRRAVAASFIEEVRLSASEAIRRADGQVDDRTLRALRRIQGLAEQATEALEDSPKATRVMARAVPLLDGLSAPAQPHVGEPHPFNPETTLAQHVGNVRRHVAKALGVLSGVELRVRAPREMVDGVAAGVALRLVPHDERLVDGAPTFRVESPEGWTIQPAEERERPRAARFLLVAPARLRGARVLTAHAAARLTDGTPLVLYADVPVTVEPQIGPPAVIGVARTAQAPALDGVLDDPCWQNADAAGGFVHFEKGSPVSQQTVARVAWDDGALYVAFDCKESRMEAIAASTQPDGRETEGQVLNDDCVLVYIDTAAKREACVQFAANALGAHRSRAGIPFDAAASRRGDGWSAELRIPFAKLGAAPKTGEAWGINFYRNEWRLGEFSAWSCTYGPYSTPERFGVVRFGQ